MLLLRISDGNVEELTRRREREGPSLRPLLLLPSFLFGAVGKTRENPGAFGKSKEKSRTRKSRADDIVYHPPVVSTDVLRVADLEPL